MEDNIFVTILHPTFNRSPYSTQSIWKPYAKQSYTSFGGFIIDDGSGDNTKSG